MDICDATRDNVNHACKGIARTRANVTRMRAKLDTQACHVDTHVCIYCIVTSIFTRTYARTRVWHACVRVIFDTRYVTRVTRVIHVFPCCVTYYK